MTDTDKENLGHNIARSLRIVEDWLTSQNLSMAWEKSEAVLLKGARRGAGDDIEADGHSISFASDIKYLGITLDQCMSYGPHIKKAAVKAEATVNALCRVMTNIGGPSEGKRRTLT